MIISFDKFWDEIKLAGRASGKFEIISRNENIEYLDRWQDYCIRQGFAQNDPRWQQRAEFFERCVRGGAGITVPCKDPADFDPAMYAGKPYRPRPKLAYVENADAETRRMAAQLARKMAQGFRATKAKPYVARPQTPDEKLAELLTKRDTPIAVSAPLMATIGRRQDIAAE